MRVDLRDYLSAKKKNLNLSIYILKKIVERVKRIFDKNNVKIDKQKERQDYQKTILINF